MMEEMVQAVFAEVQHDTVKGLGNCPSPVSPRGGMSPGNETIALFKGPGMLPAPFSFSVLCCQEPASLSRGVTVKFASESHRDYTGEKHRESESELGGNIALLGRKMHFCGVEEVGLQLF